MVARAVSDAESFLGGVFHCPHCALVQRSSLTPAKVPAPPSCSGSGRRSHFGSSLQMCLQLASPRAGRSEVEDVGMTPVPWAWFRVHPAFSLECQDRGHLCGCDGQVSFPEGLLCTGAVRGCARVFPHPGLRGRISTSRLLPMGELRPREFVSFPRGHTATVGNRLGCMLMA